MNSSTTTAVAPAPTNHIPTITNADRCDADCGAQAYVRAEYARPDAPYISTLHFCAHHFRKMKANIIEKAVEIVDETHFLEKAASRTESDGNDAR